MLNAVVEADHPPTVPQIGRSYGQPRQIVQRAANSLIDMGLIEAVPNPDHKRAVLLRATEQGIAVKREIDARADALAGSLWPEGETQSVREATQVLRTFRKQLEAHLRGLD